MTRRLGLGIAAAMIVAATSLTAAVTSAMAGPVHRPGVQVSRVPRIVARPDSVMVNTRTQLSGSGFVPHRRLTIWECSARNWIVPQRVCNHRNALHVTTSAAGRFKVSLEALVCPLGMHVIAAGFSRTCYVGVPAVRGIDTVTLVGAAEITVTGP